jgi:hypothetical protein
LPVTRRGVDQPRAGEHPRRGDRNELDQQRRAGDEHHGRPDVPVVPAMPAEEPDQRANEHREVQHRVVQVERLDQQRVRQERMLHRDLARQVQQALGVPEPASPGEAAGRRQQRERARVHPEREQAEQQRGLAGEPPRGHQPGAAGPDQSRGEHGQAHGEHRGLLPPQPYVRHLAGPL